MNILRHHTKHQASQVMSRVALKTINEIENNRLLLFDWFYFGACSDLVESCHIHGLDIVLELGDLLLQDVCAHLRSANYR